MPANAKGWVLNVGRITELKKHLEWIAFGWERFVCRYPLACELEGQPWARLYTLGGKEVTAKARDRLRDRLSNPRAAHVCSKPELIEQKLLCDEPVHQVAQRFFDLDMRAIECAPPTSTPIGPKCRRRDGDVDLDVRAVHALQPVAVCDKQSSCATDQAMYAVTGVWATNTPRSEWIKNELVLIDGLDERGGKRRPFVAWLAQCSRGR